jgi:hypothetical protein
LLDQRQAFTNLQHGSGVGDVLCGGAPVTVFTQACRGSALIWFTTAMMG